MLPHRYEPVVQVEDHGKSVSKSEVGVSASALPAFEANIVPYIEISHEFGEGVVVFGDICADLFDKLEQYFVGGDGARLYDEPFLPLLENAGEIEPFKYDKAPANWVVFLEISYQNGIGTAKDS